MTTFDNYCLDELWVLVVERSVELATRIKLEFTIFKRRTSHASVEHKPLMQTSPSSELDQFDS
jgi:hypothetical protein